MNGPNGNRLKHILAQVPPGFLVDSRWLAASDVAKSSASDYHREGWLERVARGVYRRPYAKGAPDALVEWKLAVLSAQWIMGYDFHVGGMTALSLEGRNHYLGLGRSANLYLYGDVPGWLSRLELDAHVLRRRRQLFGSGPLGIDDQDFDPAARQAPSPWDWPLRRSSPERALLEALNELPDQESFHTVDMLFQGLASLRPGRLTTLLLACKSVKVKRLFFLFADRHRHKWLAHIDRSEIDLGKGPRMLVEGGRYVAAYELVVPEEFATPASSEPHDGP
ncbi:type IV toxin-antitoxin system AbiEi family antitoxin domain-containing protein [Stakelama saccharophila]|uniref:Type IV toxin-antitoxin system AbiEi family antitoxin domain-containing protein n=1 Tax=Stakelama saccharophila TaxID=3075605 RepID=A0ABZ0B9U0_9SPHN|nr:type IV toxin-antitoxin system AbiEi family antitoxin domain-containing protein [Stakelama sp. W311]WNO54118.1 type IV toxin-antitoxin system AbiEi family antitoxin domain-containing protein [Stakelama sp. W311]